MKQEQSTAKRSLRAVALAITLVSVVALSTILYSVYADYNGTLGAFGEQSPDRAIGVKTVVQGGTVVVQLNVTIPNKGLYVLDVGLSCISNSSAGVACTDAAVKIPPGGEQTLHFVMTVNNPGPQGSLPTGIKGKVSLSLGSFASLDLVLDLSSLVGKGG